METSEMRLFRAFLVLMDECSVTRSSERLGLSQSATSHLLHRLRTWFQDPLLIRSRTGMVPTARALEVQEIVRGILIQHDRLIKPTEHFDYVSSKRTFVISASEFSERLLIPPLFRRLRREAPGVKVVVRPPDPNRVLQMLENGTLDLRIAWLTSPFKSLRSIPLIHDPLVCIADRKYGDSLSVSQFLSMPTVRTYNYNQTATRRVIDSVLEEQGYKLTWQFIVQNFQVIPEMIPGTDLIAILPRMLARIYAEQANLQIIEPPVRLPPARYSAFWHERHQEDAEHKWFRSILASVAKTLVK